MKDALRTGAAILAAVSTIGAASAQTPTPPPLGEPSGEDKIMAALTGGISGDRWKEGLLQPDLAFLSFHRSLDRSYPA